MRENRDESAGLEGASKVEEKESDNESKAGEDHCGDSNGSDVSDELVSLVTAGASFLKPSGGWYKAETRSAHSAPGKYKQSGCQG